MMGRIDIALLHYPVLDRNGRVITSAVTNADIHDIARSARTYGVRRFFIVTPIAEQADLVKKIIGHWTHGAGGTLNPARREALEAVQVAGTLEEIIQLIDQEESGPVNIVATGARLKDSCVSHVQLSELMEKDDCAYLLVFGTGWGLAGEVVEHSSYRLEPIHGSASYNHLSVRSAVAVTLDRLVGRKKGVMQGTL